MGRLAVPAAVRAQRFKQNIGSIAYSAGATSPPLKVPQTDYTTGFEILSSQQVVVGATAPVVAGYGAFGPLANISVSVNGARKIFSLNGYQADAYGRVRMEPYASQLTASPIGTNTTNNWTNHVWIPLTINEDSERGCWYTGDTELNMQITITGGAPAQAFSTVNGATIQGSWTVVREMFNAPPPYLSAQWLDAVTWFHEVIVQGSQVQLKNGVTTFDLPRDQDYQRVMLNGYTGNNSDGTFAPADALLQFIDLALDTKVHIFDTIPEASMRFEQARTYAQVLTAGWQVLDFQRIKDSIRDILPSDSSLVKILRLGITSNSTSNNVDVITESVYDNPFAQKFIAEAQRRSGRAA